MSRQGRSAIHLVAVAMLAMPLAAAIKLLLILLLARVAAAVLAAAAALPTTVVLSTLVDALIVALIVLFRVHPDLLLGSTMSPRKNGPVWQIVPELIGRERRFERALYAANRIAWARGVALRDGR